MIHPACYPNVELRFALTLLSPHKVAMLRTHDSDISNGKMGQVLLPSTPLYEAFQGVSLNKILIGINDKRIQWSS